MYIATVPNRSSPPAILIRESYREGDKVKSRTLTNITTWPREKIEALRALLQGEDLVRSEDAFQIVRSLPHGHVVAVLGMLRQLNLHRMISSKPCPELSRVLAMIVARIIDPRSKLATAQGFSEETATTSLGEILGVQSADSDDLYAAMDWLLPRQEKIEKALAKKHLEAGTLALYDATSTYFEGRTCPLAKIGHSRDQKPGTLQIVIGLLCTREGCPIAVRVFEGNKGDPKTLAEQVIKIRSEFGLKQIVMVGDRGMITEARIRVDLKPHEGVHWITALRSPAIRKLVQSGAIQRSLFDDKDLATITDPAYPSERLIVCMNPILAGERARKREALLQATEKNLNVIAAATKRSKRPLRGKAEIGVRVGKVLNQFKVAKHFHIQITDDGFHHERKQENISAESALDGIYVIRTSLEDKSLPEKETVRAYKGLSVVERAFRCIKTVDLKVRPIHHRLEDRVRVHVFLCMLAYYVEWHMRTKLSPILFDDDDKASAEAARPSPVSPAKRSERAEAKAATKRTEDHMPVLSFRELLKHLATLTKNWIKAGKIDSPTFVQLAQQTTLQQRVFELLEVPCSA